MDKKSLSPGKRVAIGIVVCAAGVGVVALGVYQLGPKANVFAAWEFAALPVGMTVAFVGALLALPRSVVRTRALIGALMISALALTADWIAFGPGGPNITGNLGRPLQTSLMISRILFRVMAVLVDLMPSGRGCGSFWYSAAVLRPALDRALERIVEMRDEARF